MSIVEKRVSPLLSLSHSDMLQFSLFPSFHLPMNSHFLSRRLSISLSAYSSLSIRIRFRIQNAEIERRITSRNNIWLPVANSNSNAFPILNESRQIYCQPDCTKRQRSVRHIFKYLNRSLP